ncbi:Ankyrin repeat protein [Rickettsiales bacterium Ac37b]|nr:Ankyrin repeat protein [Rickettsiales bacterium Ac37b]
MTIKEYRQHSEIDPHWNKWVLIRNNIAHSKSFGSLVNSPNIIYSNLQECFMLKEKIAVLLKDHNFEILSKNFPNSLPQEEKSTKSKVIEKPEFHKLENIRKNKEAIIKAEKIKQDEQFLETEFQKSLAIKQSKLLKLDEEDRQWHNLINGIFEHNVEAVSEVLKNYKGDINKNIKFTLRSSIDNNLLFYLQDYSDLAQNVILIKALPSITSPEQVIYLTPLAIAIKTEDSTENLEICTLLKAHNPNPNVLIIDDVGKLHPLLHDAIVLSSEKKVRLLLELGANPDAVDYRGLTALKFAVIKYTKENIMENIIDNLIEYGVNLDFKPNLEYSTYMNTITKSINMNALQVCSANHTNTHIALKIIKTALLQGGLYYACKLMHEPYRIVQEKEDSQLIYINNRDTLRDCMDRSDNHSMKKLGRLMTNIVQIGIEGNLETRRLYIDIVENNHEQVTSFFKEKSPEEICKIFSHKIQITVSKYFEGLTALTLANELQHISMLTSLKEIYSDALKTVQQQNKYQAMIKNEHSQESTLQRM